MPTDPSRVQGVFLEVVESSDPAGYAAALDRACAGDAELRRRVEGLLEAHQQPAELLDRPIVGRDGRAALPFGWAPGEAPGGESETRRGGVSVMSGPTLHSRPIVATGGGGPSQMPSLPVPVIPDYEILGELGRGGMGVVFEARQISLNRPVALKMIRAGALADEDELSRFQNEAQAVALLDHPGIVPIYEVGEHGGQPYFSMKLVPGGSLAAHLEEYTGDPKAAARLVAEAADAVAHAHARGILHRDLKPANILVDAEGHPHVTDFGLAKRMGGEPELTATGAILGSPGYMAPEQATGPRGCLTTATDVYGLGAVLYSLLTGRPPFEGESLFTTLDSLLTRAPESPTILNANVPRDLETVCLKCLEKDPHRRYPSARALADDLRAWLGARPIAARRIAAPARGWLWCKRQPVVAALVATVAVSVIGGTATLIAVQAAANRALAAKNADLTAALGREAKANTELAAANTELAAASRRVEQRFDLAKDAIRTLHTGVSEDFLLKQDQFKDLRDRLLGSASGFYGKLGKLLDHEADPASRRDLLRANYELARLTEKVGRGEDALSAHRAVLAARDTLAARPGADAETKSDLGLSLRAVAGLLRSTGRGLEARSLLERAQALYEELTTAQPESPGLRDAQARVLVDLGHYLSTVEQRPEEAERLLRRAVTLWRELAARNPGKPAYRFAQVEALRPLAICRADKGAYQETVPLYEQIVSLDEERLAAQPDHLTSRAILVQDRRQLSSWYQAAGRDDEAIELARRSLSDCEEVVRAGPGVTTFHLLRELGHAHLGTLLAKTGRAVEAEAEYRAALAIARRLVDEHPAITVHRSRLAQDHTHLAELLNHTHRRAEAEAEYRAAVTIWTKLADDNPGLSEHLGSLAQCHEGFGGLLSQAGRWAEAEAEYRAAVALCRRLSAESPAALRFRRSLAENLQNLGNRLIDRGRVSQADAAYREALTLKEELAGLPPEHIDTRLRAAGLAMELATTFRRLGHSREAGDFEDRGLAAYESLVKDHPDEPRFRRPLAESLLDRGLARRREGDPAGAAADVRRSLRLREGAAVRTAEEWFRTACCHAALASLAGCEGSSIPADGASSLAESAMTELRRAVAMGYRNADAFRTEDSLDPLRGRDDFRLLLLDLAFPAEPFARTP